MRLVVPGVILIVVLVLLLNPVTSPFSSIRDSDGDGVPDPQDAAANDKTLWKRGSAAIDVTIENAYSHSSIETPTFALYFGDQLVHTGDLLPGGVDLSETFTWLYGSSSSRTMTVEGICNYYPDQYTVLHHSDIETLHIVDGGTYSADLAI